MRVQIHGKYQFHGIAIMPDSIQDEIAARFSESFQRPAIEYDLPATVSPIGNTKTQCQSYRPRALERESRASFVRKFCSLRYSYALFLPVDLRSNVEVYINALIIPEVNT